MSEIQVIEPQRRFVRVCQSRQAGMPKLAAMDYMTLGYLAVTGLLFLLWSRPGLILTVQLLSRAIVAAAILALVRAAQTRRSRVLDFFRYAYPLILSAFVFGEIGHRLADVIPFWFEPGLLAVEAFLFRGYPTLWLARHTSPELLEFMSFGYSLYYLLLPTAAILAYVRRPRHQAIEFMTLVSSTLYSCYLLFYLLPARGPHHALLQAIPFASGAGPLYRWLSALQSYAAVIGGAFPSSHVAAAWAVLFALGRMWPRAAAWTVVPVLWITVAVVFVFYHYAVDALGGVAIAVIAYMFWRRRLGEAGFLPGSP